MDKSPFVTSVDKRSQSDAAKSRLNLANSDQLTLYSAFIGLVHLIWYLSNISGRSVLWQCWLGCKKCSRNRRRFSIRHGRRSVSKLASSRTSFLKLFIELHNPSSPSFPEPFLSLSLPCLQSNYLGPRAWLHPDFMCVSSKELIFFHIFARIQYIVDLLWGSGPPDPCRIDAYEIWWWWM